MRNKLALSIICELCILLSGLYIISSVLFFTYKEGLIQANLLHLLCNDYYFVALCSGCFWLASVIVHEIGHILFCLFLRDECLIILKPLHISITPITADRTGVICKTQQVCEFFAGNCLQFGIIACFGGISFLMYDIRLLIAAFIQIPIFVFCLFNSFKNGDLNKIIRVMSSKSANPLDGAKVANISHLQKIT